MTECEEVASTMKPPKFASFDDALRYVAKQMPGEDPSGTIVNNVAWALWRFHEAAKCLDLA